MCSGCTGGMSVGMGLIGPNTEFGDPCSGCGSYTPNTSTLERCSIQRPVWSWCYTGDTSHTRTPTGAANRGLRS